MKRIHLLPDTVKSKIAAGEVIEGPFSIVKELMENSLDAGASEIVVQVFDSGMKKIMVKDNGYGIVPDDIQLAIAEHATSKINDIHDIEKISTFGFRGEALSSIASVSELTILSRPVEFEIGKRLTGSQGNYEESDFAGPAGTTVIVENLFFDIPARKKFLKSKGTESRFIREIFLKIAVANPGVSFFLEVDEKRKVSLQAVDDTGLRIQQVYGKETFSRLHYQKIQDIKVIIEGFLSSPDGLFASRNMQLLFINGRPVDHKYFSFILSRAYEGIAIKGKYPAALVFLSIDPTLVDVNIHPSKREVKLFDQRYIDSLIYALAEKTLNRSHQINSTMLESSSRSFENTEERDVETQLHFKEQSIPLRYDNPHTPDSVNEDHTPEKVRDMAELYESINVNNNLLMGVVFGAYIVYQEDELLTFIDFHAAHERMIYDTLLAAPEEVISQELLFPKVFELSIGDYYIINENLNTFSEIGFDIETFSDNAIIIRTVPVLARNIEPESIINEFLESMHREDSGTMNVRDKVAASVACHSAKRAGDLLTVHEQQAIIDYIKQGPRELRCPHGRPFVYTLSKNELERLFKRS